MSKKTSSDAGYQLDPKEFHTGNMIADMIVDKAVAAVNKLDLNHDGQADIAEIAPFVLALWPKLVKLWGYVHVDTFVASLAGSPAFHESEAEAKEVLKEVSAIFNQMSTLLEAKASAAKSE